MGIDIIRILGTEYRIVTDNELLCAANNDGFCDTYEKVIKVRTPDKMLNDTTNYDSKVKRYNEVLRHEIMHAYLYEAGLDEYSTDETLVNWIAIQFNKICETFKDCLISEKPEMTIDLDIKADKINEIIKDKIV